MFSGFHAWYYSADILLGCYAVLDNNFVLPLEATYCLRFTVTELGVIAQKTILK